MAEQTNLASKMNFRELIKKHCNYPMLLLAIVLLFKIKPILSSFVSVFTTLFTQPNAILGAVFSFFINVAPLAILFLLWLHRNKKFEKAKLIIAIIFSCLALLQVRSLLNFIVFVVPQAHISFDADFVVHQLPSILNNIFDMLLYVILSIILFFNRKKYVPYYIIIVLYIAQALFFGIIVSLLGVGSLSNAFLTVLYALYLWYIPKALESAPSSEITKGKGKALIAIAAVTLFIFFVSGASVGGGSSSNVSTNTCGSCGRSYKAGDAGGNFMSIAKSGLCKNCNSNREYFEWIFD